MCTRRIQTLYVTKCQDVNTLQQPQPASSPTMKREKDNCLRLTEGNIYIPVGFFLLNTDSVICAKILFNRCIMDGYRSRYTYTTISMKQYRLSLNADDRPDFDDVTIKIAWPTIADILLPFKGLQATIMTFHWVFSKHAIIKKQRKRWSERDLRL